MICPPDVLCEWLHEDGRWETMEELAMALERETLNSIGGRPCPPKIGRPRLELPTPLTRRVQSDIEKRKAAKKRKEKNWTKATYKIERMMSLACPKRKRYAA